MLRHACMAGSHWSRSRMMLFRSTVMDRTTPSLLFRRRSFSSTTSSTTQSSSSSLISFLTQRGTRWHRLGMILRYTRIPILVLGVYGLGYQQGIIDCTRTPLAMQKGILLSILKQAGIASYEDDVHVLHEDDVWNRRRRRRRSPQQEENSANTTTTGPDHDYRRQVQVAVIGSQILRSAIGWIHEQQHYATQQALQTKPKHVHDQEWLQQDETVQYWNEVLIRFQGEDPPTSGTLRPPWQYLFLNSPIVNAFVTEILPRKFFITTAMLELATTPDEMAVVLGHEASHLILGHISQTNKVEMLLRTMEVLLLSLDPTEGILSVAVVGVLATLHHALAAAHSREHEWEADALGLELAARACFDTEQGVFIMYKMHQVAQGLDASRLEVPDMTVGTGSSRSRGIPSLLDSHPPSLERYQRLQRMSREENPRKYRHSHCMTLSSRFYKALWGVPDNGTPPRVNNKE